MINLQLIVKIGIERVFFGCS